MFSQLNAAAKSIIKNVVEIVYYMRGSVQYDDIMWRTPVEKQIMEEFIRERLESESKKPYPVY